MNCTGVWDFWSFVDPGKLSTNLRPNEFYDADYHCVYRLGFELMGQGVVQAIDFIKGPPTPV